MKTLSLLVITLFGISTAFTPPPTCATPQLFPYTYPYVSGQTDCEPYSVQKSVECQKYGQFGFEYRPCSHHKFRCQLKDSIAATNKCPDNRVMVKNVTLRHNFPVDISLDITVPGDTQDIILLVDASQSTRAKLNGAKEQLKSFVRTLGDIGNVSVAYYGGESAMGETGFSVVLKATSDVNRAAEALNNIPTVADGPRTSLTALSSIIYHQDGSIPLGLNAARKIIVLVGDTPGREPECRYGIKSDYMNFFEQRTRVMVVNLATPGLNAALPAPEACGYSTPVPVAAGQGTRIAETSKGELVSDVTSAKLRTSVLELRKNAKNSLYGKGCYISVLSTTRTVTEYTCPSSYCKRTYTTKGCDDRVLLTTSNIPGYAQGPVKMTGTISLDLPRGICQKGPFYCEVEVRERQDTYSYSHWSLPNTRTQLIGVKACQ